MPGAGIEPAQPFRISGFYGLKGYRAISHLNQLLRSKVTESARNHHEVAVWTGCFFLRTTPFCESSTF
jgi:hypothetical protein